MSYSNNSGGFGLFLSIVFILVIMAGPAVCSMNECDTICRASKAETRWTFTQGCYCADDEGLYNPKDERSR